MQRIEKTNNIWTFLFKFNNYLFSNGTATTNKVDDGIPVVHFRTWKYRYSKRCLNYKQIRRQYIGNTFFRTPSTGTWTTNKLDGGIPVTHFLQHRYFWQKSTSNFFCWKWRWGQISIKLTLSSSAANFNSQTIYNWNISGVFYVRKFLKCYSEPILF